MMQICGTCFRSKRASQFADEDTCRECRRLETAHEPLPEPRQLATEVIEQQAKVVKEPRFNKHDQEQLEKLSSWFEAQSPLFDRLVLVGQGDNWELCLIKEAEAS